MATAVTLGLVSPAVASAQTPAQVLGESCARGYTCIWRDAARAVDKYQFKPTASCYRHGYGKSASNQSGKRVRFYKSHGCTGTSFDLPTGTYRDDTPFVIGSSKTV